MRIKKNKFIIEPEEILLDEKQKLAKRLEFSLEKRYVLLVAVLAIGFLGLSWFLSFYYQIIQFPEFKEKAYENSLRNIFLEAPRGVILDRYGKVVAENKVFYQLVLTREKLSQDQSELNRQVELLAKILEIPTDQILEKIDSSSEPILEKNLDLEKAIKIKANEADLPGFKLVGRFERVYPFGASLSHVLGYTGFVSQSDLDQDSALSLNQTIGKAGVELIFDNFLRGKQGKLNYLVDARNELVDEKEIDYFQPGSRIELAIDAELQDKIYQVLKRNVTDSKSGAVGIGLNPKTGEILALVNYPGYDLSEGAAVEKVSQLFSSPAKPFFNRTVSGEYSPGSTIKPFIALAALEENLIDPQKKIDDTEGRIIVPNPYFPDQPYIFRDWKAHGFVDMEQAIADSCNVYFYTIGGGYGNQDGLGAERIKSYLEKFGWGEKTGIEFINENQGFLPDPDWKQNQLNDPWRLGDTYLYAIGQGYVRETPIQLAVNYQLFANQGTIYKPFLVKKITDSQTGELISQTSPEILRTVGVKKENILIVNQGMKKTITQGSARSLADLPFSLAGKTGSAQTSSSLSETNALFISFMPYEDPEFLLLILVEAGGSGGARAVPLAKEIMFWYWENRLSSY
ncbi:MAG: penicillin-binding protein 2 [Patescibacteria group bacterium]